VIKLDHYLICHLITKSSRSLIKRGTWRSRNRTPI